MRRVVCREIHRTAYRQQAVGMASVSANKLTSAVAHPHIFCLLFVSHPVLQRIPENVWSSLSETVDSNGGDYQEE